MEINPGKLLEEGANCSQFLYNMARRAPKTSDEHDQLQAVAKRIDQLFKDARVVLSSLGQRPVEQIKKKVKKDVTR